VPWPCRTAQPLLQTREHVCKNKGRRIHTKLHKKPNILSKQNLPKPGTDQDHLLIKVFKSNTKKINRPAHSCNIKPAKELTPR
jgi:hypothetical protein